MNYLPVLIAFLAAATWRNTTNSTIVAVVACVVGTVRLLTQTRYPVLATGAVVFSDCSSEAGRYAAGELSRYSGKGDRFNYHVLCGVRNAEDADSISQESYKMHPFLLNITDSSSIKKGYKEVKGILAQKNLQLVAVVNSWSVEGKVAPVDELVDSDYRQIMDEAFIGPAKFFKKFLPLVKNSKGRVVQMGSVLGFISLPFTQPYSAAHHAIESYMDTLRREVRDHEVSVSIIRQGWFEGAQQDIADKGSITDFFTLHSTAKWESKHSKLFAKGRRAVAAARASKNIGGLTELAKTVTHAISDSLPQTRYVIGAVVEPRLGAMPADFLAWLRYLLGDRAMDVAVALF